jgi:16S rRNA (cytosine1402-N4)-methyltransferase
MRMDRTQKLTAARLVNESDEEVLADILWRLGEESASRRIAKWICSERRQGAIETTGQLAELVERAKGGRRGKIHPATKTFQALRMAVNRELESVEAGVESALKLVAPGGRVAIISFHSLEDRVVKHGFARHVGAWESLPAGGKRWVGERPVARRITRKPVTASEEELLSNPRARSAKLRVVERVD